MYTDIKENYVYEEIIPTVKDYRNNKKIIFERRKDKET